MYHYNLENKKFKFFSEKPKSIKVYTLYQLKFFHCTQEQKVNKRNLIYQSYLQYPF